MQKNASLGYSLLPVLLFAGLLAAAQKKIVWQIGNADRSTAGMALAPDNYKQYLAHDFGWEDKFFLVGWSNPATDWPYVLPGPADSWGGSDAGSGIRSHVMNILFGLKDEPVAGDWHFAVNILDYQGTVPPLFKVIINGKEWEFPLPKHTESGALEGRLQNATVYPIDIPVEAGLLHKGGNEIQLTTIEGSWLVFDQVRLEGPGQLMPSTSGNIFVRSVKAANYAIEKDGKTFQPLLVDVEHLSGRPLVTVQLDGRPVFSQTLDAGRYKLEVPMPAVTNHTKSRYEIRCNGKLLEQGSVERTAQQLVTPADYVDTKIGSAHSRWMIAPGPWMPFSMVKLSPDNQDNGWMSGYDPTIESIGTFSHIHEWTMAGLGMLPVNGPLKIHMGSAQHPGEGYRSKMDKASEETALGYYKVQLTDYNIKAELTATTRCGFQRYTYPQHTDGRIMIDLQLPSEYPYDLEQVEIKKINDHRLEGFSKQHAASVWGENISQDYTVHFVIEFDRPIKKFGTWLNGETREGQALQATAAKDAGVFVEFDTKENPVVQARSGISLVSTENAAANLDKEITQPFGWSFDAVRGNNRSTWNNLLERLNISSNDAREKTRFYSNMYRALCSRNTWSDVDGSWVDAAEKVQKLSDPNAVALGCDAFWNTFWNLNQFWNLVTPEWSSRWVKSQLAMYDANGWLAKGPAGMEYIPVMVAEHEIPLMVSAYQMGIRDYDASKALDAMLKMQTTPPAKVGGGLAGNENLEAYLQYHYVPYDKGRFSNTLEYAYDDWTVAQFAKSLGRQQVYATFKERAGWWRNAIDTATGYARMRKSDGSWFPNFDPFKSGHNAQYVEGNAWQLSYFVPQNVPALAKTIGEKRFVDRLQWGFRESSKWRFNAPNEQYWDYPVTQGNQQSMHFAFLFNWVGKPWLTQQWSRSIIDRYYGYGIANAYLGDEDQGQMSSWFIMAALGLFQTDGGCRTAPIYEIASPLFEKVTIDLGNRYNRGKSFTITARGVSRTNKYIQSATLNGKPLTNCWFPAQELLKGGSLILNMGPAPNEKWGIQPPPVAQ